MPMSEFDGEIAAIAMRAELQAVGRAAFARGLVWATSGNISGKLPSGRLLLTKTGTDLADLADDDFTLATPGLADPAPDEVTSEIAMHRAAHAAWPDVACVLHLSPPWTTLAACTGFSIPTTTTAEAHLMLRDLARVPWHCPGTPDLGQAVERALVSNGCRALILEGHGALTLGRTPIEALRRMETLEFVAQLANRAHQNGTQLIPMTPEERAQVERRYSHSGD